jgi:hypothetical protein
MVVTVAGSARFFIQMLALPCDGRRLHRRPALSKGQRWKFLPGGDLYSDICQTTLPLSVAIDVHVAAYLPRSDSAKVSLIKSRKRVDGHVVVGMSGEGAVSDRGWCRSPRTALRIGLV